jgi:hypothetical protein
LVLIPSSPALADTDLPAAMMMSTKSWLATLTGIAVALVQVNAKPVHHPDGVSNFNTYDISLI